MGNANQGAMQADLDEALLGFRVARKAAGKVKGWVKNGWLRAVRLAAGVRVEEVARRLEVSRSEVFRLEKAEMEARITVKSLRRAANALGCELVYALVPREGTLKGLAEEVKRTRAAAEQEEKEQKADEPGTVLLRRAILKKFRQALRREGMRTR